MANWAKWLRIIGEILILISKGFSKNEAVHMASRKFGISVNDIWKHGGF